MNAAGYSNAFGFFQVYYGTALQESPSHISWVGSIQAFMLLFVGAFSGRAVDAGCYHHVAGTGLVLQLAGVFMTSLVSKYWQLLVTQGICQGLGGGLVLTPIMAVVATYFSTKRAVAISGASSGSATGGVIFPLIAQQLPSSKTGHWVDNQDNGICILGKWDYCHQSGQNLNSFSNSGCISGIQFSQRRLV